MDSEFEKLIKARGWKTASDDSDYIWIANHEENIKSRNIVEKIKFEREWNIIILGIHLSFPSTLDVAPVMNKN